MAHPAENLDIHLHPSAEGGTVLPFGGSVEQPMKHEELSPLYPEPFVYEQLKGHYRTDGSYKTDDQLRTEYVELTDELIRQMTDGVPVYDSEKDVFIKKKPDVVIWLDKSARPVSWLTKELWPLLAADNQGNIPEIPEFRYVNIDREQWVNSIDPQGTGFMNVGLVDKSIIRSLRSIFVSPQNKKEGLIESIDTAPTELDGKTVLIIDEVRSSGKTLSITEKFFTQAFPGIQIATTYWMRGMTQIKGKTGAVVAEGNADLPVWYKENDVSGRGVGNRDERISRKSKSQTQRIGAWFLSTSLVDNRETSNQLRRELKQLAKDAREKRILIVPSGARGVDEIVSRAEKLNDLSFEEWLYAKNKLNQI